MTRAPGSVATIWELPEQGERGPRARFSRAEIAAAAIGIADAEGLDGLTMRRVAAGLGLATMSLYTYVPAKEHLAQLMVDQLAAEYAYPAGSPAGYRAAIADFARQARDIARRHLWLPQLIGSRPPAPGPNGLRYLDYFLGLLAHSGLDTGAKLETIALISGFATTYGSMQAALAAERPRSGVTGQQRAAAQARYLAIVAASGDYPHLAAALAQAEPPRGEPEVFDSCILRLVDALTAR